MPEHVNCVSGRCRGCIGTSRRRKKVVGSLEVLVGMFPRHGPPSGAAAHPHSRLPWVIRPSWTSGPGIMRNHGLPGGRCRRRTSRKRRNGGNAREMWAGVLLPIGASGLGAVRPHCRLVGLILPSGASGLGVIRPHGLPSGRVMQPATTCHARRLRDGSSTITLAPLGIRSG